MVRGDILKTRQTRQTKIRVRVEERVLQTSPATTETHPSLELERRYRARKRSNRRECSTELRRKRPLAAGPTVAELVLALRR